MGKNTVIDVKNLSKKYLIGERSRAYKTLRDSITSGLSRFVKNAGLNKNGNRRKEFWALRDVSFEVNQGDVIGIIGHNGAGKSTLLKILSRITEPTEGYADIHGRIGSLLEVGTGFHQELTGRENIYLSGAILGMKKSDIDLKFDEIVAFAGVETFVDTPIKHYSSGMNLRLGFAVAAHLDPEILLVDEVLAVGDLEFQKKCLNKMEDVATEGRTVLFVSHNMGSIKELCRSALVLKNGRIDYQGDVVRAIQHYSQNVMNVGDDEDSDFEKKGWIRLIINGKTEQSQILNTEPFEVSADLSLLFDVDRARFVCLMEDSEGNQVVCNKHFDFEKLEKGLHRLTANFPPLYLKPGVYTLQLKLFGEAKNVSQVKYFSERLLVDITDDTGIFSGKVRATILPPVEWSISSAKVTETV
ncbi:MAG: ABC transporter ATP-binding protein [Pyrinomonadaceae bacterium]